MIYLALGEAIRQGIPLYKGIHDNKPPLLYVLAGISGSLFWFKAILAFWHLVTLYIFWKFAELLVSKYLGTNAKNKNLPKIATIIFAILTTIPSLEGNIANAELFMIGPTILGFYLLLSGNLTPKKIITAGVSFSVATLFKVPAAFDIPAIVFLWLTSSKLNLEKIREIVKNTLILLVGFATPIALTIIWYALQGAFSEYVIAAFLQNVGYLSSWRPDDVQESFLVRNGPLLIRGLVVFVYFSLLFIFKKKLSKAYIFVSAWLILTLFAVTLSERPYPHYLIQSVPPISILLAMLFTLKNIEQVLVIIPLTLASFVPYFYHFWRYPTYSYYKKFITFATGQTTKDEYFATFDANTTRNYKIAQYLVQHSKREEKVFVWGNSSVIYALSRRLPPGRYVADYHISDFSSPEETISILQKSNPKIIVILPDSSAFPALDEFVLENYIELTEIDDASIWILINSKTRENIAPNVN